MSTGSFFNAIGEAITLLNSPEFKELYTVKKYQPYQEDYSVAAQRQQAIGGINLKLEQLLREYHDLIVDLADLAKEEDVTKNLQWLKHFQNKSELFLKTVASVMDDIESMEIPSIPKKQLNQSFNQPKVAAHKALRDYQEKCQNIFAALDLPNRIKHLEDEVLSLNQSLQRSSSKKAMPQSAFELHKKSETETFDVQKIKNQSQDLKVTTENTKAEHLKKAHKYLTKSIICGACIALLVTLPIVLPLAIYYRTKASKHYNKTKILQQRLNNLENIKEDITAIQGAYKILGQDPEKISAKVDKEIQAKIESQTNDLKNAVDTLATNLGIDISQRALHSPPSSPRRQHRY